MLARPVTLALIACTSASLATASLAAAPAGGWSFAHWGMTKAQVRAAYKGAAHPPADAIGNQDDLGDGQMTIGGFKFTVQLEYGDEVRLSEVDFSLVGAEKNCNALGAWLTKT